MKPSSLGYLLSLYDEYCVPSVSHTTSDPFAYDELRLLGLATNFGEDSYRMKTKITPAGVSVIENILEYADDQFGEIYG